MQESLEGRGEAGRQPRATREENAVSLDPPAFTPDVQEWKNKKVEAGNKKGGGYREWNHDLSSPLSKHKMSHWVEMVGNK